jgi:5-methylcytosine-specific restriction protein A
VANKPLKACATAGCANVTTSGRFCDDCDQEYRRGVDRERVRDGFYQSAAWIAFRQAFLARHRLCVKCLNRGRRTLATVVNHILPRREFPDLQLIASNCEPLCKSCHDRHTAMHDGGFGNAKQPRAE